MRKEDISPAFAAALTVDTMADTVRLSWGNQFRKEDPVTYTGAVEIPKTHAIWLRDILNDIFKDNNPELPNVSH